MTHSATPSIHSRKRPKQARSEGLVATILEAAAQVLAAEGAHRFTTARVAERAGVSVGSLYQYFPNKAAILFRLQSDEWRQTTALIRDILQDGRRSPEERLRTLAHAFLRSECEEAAVRMALDDAAPLYRASPEARNARAEGTRAIARFVAEALPQISEDARTLAADLVTATLSAIGKRVSEHPRTPDAIAAYADALADMFSAYLDHLGTQGDGASQSALAASAPIR
jgi:AcrR family transcriptional regulator